MAAESISFASRSPPERRMPLWNFALALYARPGVETACLAAQDAGADVCLMLCGAWLDRRGVAFQASGAASLQALAIERQEALIKPLRNVRQQLRQAATHQPQLARLREQVKELELAAERQLLEQLERRCQDWPEAFPAPSGTWLVSLAAPLPAEHASLCLLRAQSIALITPGDTYLGG